MAARCSKPRVHVRSGGAWGTPGTPTPLREHRAHHVRMCAPEHTSARCAHVCSFQGVTTHWKPGQVMCVCFAQFTCFAQTHQQIFPINLHFFRITSYYCLCTKVQIILFAFGNSDRSDQQQPCKLFQANKYYSKFDKCSFVALFVRKSYFKALAIFLFEPG